MRGTLKGGLIVATKREKTLKAQAQEILRLAEESGVQTNQFFITTFERYQTQIEVLDKLKELIKGSETLVTKEYVKGRQNLYTNPAITEYNRTTVSANKTVATLIKIIKGFKEDNSEEDIDPLLSIINGGESDNESDNV